MKNKIVIIAAVAASSLFVACAGSSDKAPDTVSNQYGEVKSVDTTKTTTTTGSASMVDNSGSGGTNIDTPKRNTSTP